MRLSTLPRLRKDFVRACDTPRNLCRRLLGSRRALCGVSARTTAPLTQILTYRGRQRPGSLTEAQDMESRQLASRGLVALQCGQQYILRCLLRSPQTCPVCGEYLSIRGSWQLNLERKYLIVEEAVSLKTRHDWELYTHLAARFGLVLTTHKETCCRWFSSRSGRGSWIISGFLWGFFRAA
jgi:hypothetical protein